MLTSKYQGPMMRKPEEMLVNGFKAVIRKGAQGHLDTARSTLGRPSHQGRSMDRR